jgi:transcriptional regulator with XRE-family HTH domain
MRIQSIFADNLRLACSEFGTIADISRGSGINRQQLNKYLSGACVPNCVNLRKICAYLNIPEASLFGATSVKLGNHSQSAQMNQVSRFLGFSHRKLNRLDFQVTDLRCGVYFCYFPIENLRGMLVRSLVLVRENGMFKEFVRLTRFPSPDKNSKTLSGGRHTGLVCANRSTVYMMGANRREPYQLSMIALERATTPTQTFYMGVALTDGFKSQMTSRVCFVHTQGFSNIKSQINTLGIIHQSEALLDPVIVASLHS